MKNLKLNPFYMLLVFYLLINFIFFLIGFSNESVVIEFSDYKLKKNSFFISFVIQLFFVVVIGLVFFYFNKFKKKDSFSLATKHALLLFILQLFFLLYNFIYGLNIAGVEVQAPNRFINTLFVLLPADIFFILFGVYIRSGKMFYLNVLIYIVSSIVRGWMGGILLAFFVILCRQKVIYIGFKDLLKFSIVIIVSIACIPYLMQIKWVVRSGGDVLHAINIVNDYGYSKLLIDGLEYTFNRFQHNYHVALVFERYEQLNTNYNNGRILPYWAEGIFQTIFYGLFQMDRPPILGNEIAREIFGSKDTWSTNAGLAGWAIVLQEKFIIFFIYIFTMLFISFYAAVRFFDKKMLLIIGCFSIFYLFHGWIGMYVNLISYMFIFSVIKRIRL